MNVLELFNTITTFVFDVDGVLTDGSLLIMPGGLMARRMNIKDGYALQLAVKKGYHVLVISGYELTWNQVLYMGDDIPDHGVMLSVGLPCCPADAVTEIKQVSKYISTLKGGEGCARDVIEKVLKLQDKWSIDTKIKSQ